MILTELQHKLINAQKAKDDFRVSVLRYLLAGVKNKEIELRPLKKELGDEDILGVIKKQIKKRLEAIEQFQTGGRQDLVDKETREVAILKELQQEFTPQTV